MISFTIPGQPQGKARARSRIVTARDGRQFASHYTPKKTREYEDYIKWLAKKAMVEAKEKVSESPFSLTICCRFELPKSWPKWKKELALSHNIAATTKPDLDNIIKSIKDGCNNVIWLDDCQVVETTVSKGYSDHPGVSVYAKKIQSYPANIKRRPEASERLFA